jgi:iron complex outermembrane receptor protein
LSPKAGLKYEPNKALTTYFTWAQGYKSGGFNGRPLSDEHLEYEPELATSYEVGAKTRARLFGTPLQFNIAAFTTKFENLQVSTFQDGSFVISQRGVGALQRLRRRPHLAAVCPACCSVQLVRLRRRALRAIQRCAAGLQLQRQTPRISSGRPLELAPKWTASLVPAYLLPLPGPLRVTLGGDVLYRSQRYLDLDDDPLKSCRKRPWSTTRASLRRRRPKAGPLTLAGHNLTDVKIYNQALEPAARGRATWCAGWRITGASTRWI